MLGVKGPRKMVVHIPTLKYTHERNAVIPVVVSWLTVRAVSTVPDDLS